MDAGEPKICASSIVASLPKWAPHCAINQAINAHIRGKPGTTDTQLPAII